MNNWKKKWIRFKKLTRYFLFKRKFGQSNSQVQFRRLPSESKEITFLMQVQLLSCLK